MDPRFGYPLEVMIYDISLLVFVDFASSHPLHDQLGILGVWEFALFVRSPIWRSLRRHSDVEGIITAKGVDGVSWE